tara:strand:+ start:580 stop:1176 length:597 start_codon:yes stop_codon:yes gene_type:complete
VVIDMSHNILIGCEESQVVTNAFRALGFNAFSCDLKPTRGNPEFHYQDDIFNVLPAKDWSLIILHPDCTAMSLSGNRWYGVGMPKHHYRKYAIKWTRQLWLHAMNFTDRLVLEKPTSVIFKHLNSPVQYIQPYQFGHGETKKTGLALHNVPALAPTDEVPGRENRIWRMSPSANRKRDRSVTYPGIAAAMAQQWGAML